MTKGFRCKINDWYGIHQGFNLLLRPGYTALVGPNGAGKSTLLRQIKELAEKRGYDVFWYSNQEDGDTIAMERNVLRGNMSFVAASLCSSEGERVALSFGTLFLKLASASVKTSQRISPCSYSSTALTPAHLSTAPENSWVCSS